MYKRFKDGFQATHNDPQPNDNRDAIFTAIFKSMVRCKFEGFSV